MEILNFPFLETKYLLNLKLVHQLLGEDSRLLSMKTVFDCILTFIKIYFLENDFCFDWVHRG